MVSGSFLTSGVDRSRRRKKKNKIKLPCQRVSIRTVLRSQTYVERVYLTRTTSSRNLFRSYLQSLLSLSSLPARLSVVGSLTDGFLQVTDGRVRRRAANIPPGHDFCILATQDALHCVHAELIRELF